MRLPSYGTCELEQSVKKGGKARVHEELSSRATGADGSEGLYTLACPSGPVLMP